MKRVVKYKAIDPYYSDITQTYIGMTPEEIDNIQYETEEHMRGEHSSLSTIYESHILDDSDCEEYYKNRRIFAEEGLCYENTNI